MKWYGYLFILSLCGMRLVFAELHVAVMTSTLDEEAAELQVPISFQTHTFQVSSASISVKVSIEDDEGSRIAEQSSTQFIKTDSSAFGSLNISISQPKLWSTESPTIYKADVSLFQDEKLIEQTEIRFGIRLLDVIRGEWRMNGTRLQIKGVVYHYHPEYWQTDLQLMQQAHINAIRVEKQYPSADFLSACDVMGMMVICHPPEGTNAKPFVPSHPSIIAWELSLSPTLELAVTTLQGADSSRVIIAAENPAVPSHTWKIETPASLPPIQWLQRRTKPLLLLNEPQIDGHKMEGLEEGSGLLNAGGNLAGLFIDRFSSDDSNEGIVTAERAITPNYEQVKRVFSPIQIKEEHVEIKPGVNAVELNVFNSFQQINLSETTCQWALFQDQKAIQNGSLFLSVPPQKSFEMEIECVLPDEIDRHFYFMVIHFMAGNQLLYKHVIRLLPKQWEEKLVLRLDDLTLDDEWTVNTKVEGSEFRHEHFLFEDQSPQAGWFLMTQDGHVRLITEGPFVMTSEEEIHSSTPSGLIRNFWKTKSDVNRENRNIVAQTTMHSIQHEQDVNMELTTLFSPFGFMDMRFQLYPTDEKMKIDVLGLGFRLSPTLTLFQYAGKGPYPSYPGRRALNQFGIFSFEDWNRFIPGNREQVTTAVFTGKHGYGLGIMMLNGSLSVQPSDEGAWVSINAAVAGLGSHNHETQYPINVEDIPQNGYSAAFRLIPLNKNKVPDLFKSTFK